MDRRNVGLVLGSGSSRGWAHIGVIEALQDAGIPIHLVAGCSVGAFVGAIFASGGLEQLKKYPVNIWVLLSGNPGFGKPWIKAAILLTV